MQDRDSAVAPSVQRLACALLASVLMCGSAWAESSLIPHTAIYRVRISILSGVLRTELNATDTGYIATHVIKPTGLSKIIARGTITETSEFTSTADGIRPAKYRSEDTLSRHKKKTAIEFDWGAGEARGTVNGEDVVSILDQLAHDRVSIQYQLMHDLRNDGPAEQYLLFDVDKPKLLTVRNIGKKIVTVPAGEFEAIGIQHQAANSHRVTTLWCVEALGYLPVIIEQHRKGKLRVRATLQNYLPTQT